MRIDLRFRPPMRRWQHRLVEDLTAAGHRVACVADSGRKALPRALGIALALQQRVFGPRPSLFDAVSIPSSAATDSAADLTLVLDGSQSDAETILEPLFDGAVGDQALLAMLARGGTPCVHVRLLRSGSAIDLATARLAVENRNVLSRAADQVLARIVTLILHAVRRFEAGFEGAPAAAPPRNAQSAPLAAMASGFARKLAARVPGTDRGPSHWRIGYRHVAAGGVAQTRAWPVEGFTILPGTADRFYADPMPFEQDGRFYLFFEDYPYATGKGLIGLVEIAADGTASKPRTVLDQPFHLSYPLVLRHDGVIYMLPEMSAARRVQFFRADPFPDCWVPDKVLMDEIVASDATPIFHDGRWWLFATLSGDGGSTWDQLGLFHAPDLFGPWTPHADNPVLVDAGEARPAGPLWHEDGVLMRVAQDCRTGYGVGLAICRVDRLDEKGYAQTVVTRLGPPERHAADGVHTLARAGALEVIDLRGRRRS